MRGRCMFVSREVCYEDTSSQPTAERRISILVCVRVVGHSSLGDMKYAETGSIGYRLSITCKQSNKVVPLPLVFLVKMGVLIEATYVTYFEGKAL